MIDKQPARIAGMFDRIAGAYDFLNQFLSAGSHHRWRRHAIRALGLTGRERILDLCAGTADFGLAALNGPNRASRVVGVDFSDGMLRLGLRKIRKRGLVDRFCLVRGDAVRLPLGSSSMDAVIVAFGLRNIERIGEALQEIRRVLVEEGRVVILEFAMPQQGPARGLYLWYFTRVLPAVGRLVSGDASAYTYLPASVRAFPRATELMALLRDHGFADVTADPLSGGIVYVHMGRKIDMRRGVSPGREPAGGPVV